MVEALNKVIKKQVLYPLHILSRTSLEKILAEIIQIYNYERPQMSLNGNTPEESFNGIPSNFDTYKASFVHQKQLRRTENKKNRCKGCI